jgi:hypothetical protein
MTAPLSFVVRYLSFLLGFSQKTITGVVSDAFKQPLESANLIAKPLQEKSGIIFLKSFIYYFSKQVIGFFKI